ncbi:ATP-binding protein [Streptomyces flavalbus]|uniref:ATP-binding protein n=1 Tax=Streptomyces flavalbus TaxID=2665155 RepID=A0ABW2W4T2_9ACTN
MLTPTNADHHQPGPRPAHAGDVLANRVEAARSAAFIGRDRQLGAFARLLAAPHAKEPPRPMLYVHGSAGMGKTALLRRYADLARQAGRQVLAFDAAEVDSPGRLQHRLAATPPQPDGVVLLDGMDVYRGAARQVAEVLACALPDGAVAVLSGRRPPEAPWLEDVGWHDVLQVVPLGPLPRSEADATLVALGVSAAHTREAIVRFSHGHPLGLALAAAAASAGTFTDDQAPRELVLDLLDRMLGDVPGPEHRTALEASAHSRWTTEDLLRAVLEDPRHAGDAFDWLRRRPFVSAERHGVTPEPLVRDLLDADFRWRDPSGYRAMHQRIRRHVLQQMEHAQPDSVLHATLALTYLHRHNGFVSRFVTWSENHHVTEITYRRELRAELLRFITEAEGKSAASTAERWLDSQPRAFLLYWDTDRQRIVGALAWLQLDMELGPTPLAAAAWHHAQTTRPLRPQEQAALCRPYGPPSLFREPSPLLDLMIHRVLAHFIVSKPRAWTYIGLPTGTFLDPLMRYIDQRPLPDPVVTENASFTLYAHDWRAVTLERWMQVGHMVELAGPDARPAARRGERTDALTVLTREEFDTAVAEALSAWQRKDLLADNPLTRTRMVAERGESDAAQALREVLAEALDTLGSDPRLQKYHRAVVTGLLRGAPTRETAAERLGLPLSTFRRHLARGIDEIRSYLWNAELRSPPPAGGSAPADAPSS